MKIFQNQISCCYQNEMEKNRQIYIFKLLIVTFLTITERKAAKLNLTAMTIYF